jgi:hypothetical protein
MVFFISEPVINTNCFSRKNKTNGIEIQCPHKKKLGDYCGRHKDANKWRFRIDKQLNNAISIDNISNKKTKSVKILITREDYKSNPELNNFNYDSLRLSCKKYKLLLSSNRSLIVNVLIHYFESINDYQKYEKEVILLQRNIRRFLKDRHNKLRGPGFYNRAICNNTEDFLSFEPLINLSIEQFFSYKDNNNFVYGFDINSFKKLIEKKMNNPYNRSPIPNLAIKNMDKIFEIQKTEEETQIVHLTKKQKLTHRVIKIFQEIDRLGTYAGGADINWFLDMSNEKLKLYYKTLEDIWNYRADLSTQQKARIAPFQDTFVYTIHNYYKIPSIHKLRDVLLGEMEKLVFTAEQDSDKALGCYYILIAFVEINPVCANAMPWLIQG